MHGHGVDISFAEEGCGNNDIALLKYSHCTYTFR